MDIFKAIFDDSSESESSSEEEEDEKSEHVAMDTVEPISEYSSQKEPEKAADHPIKTVNSGDILLSKHEDAFGSKKTNLSDIGFCCNIRIE